MHEADTTTSRSSNGSTNDYGPNKGPRVGDNNITESAVPNVTDVSGPTTTEMPTESYTDYMVDFHVDEVSPITSTTPNRETVEIPTETTTNNGDDGITTKRPKVRYETTLDYDESTAPTIFTTDPNPKENITVISMVKMVDNNKTVLPMQCNNVNDCAPNERCINNKCTKLCDTTNSNRSSVDCMPGICK